MAKKSMIAKQKRTQKFSSREYNRCPLCGSPRGFMGRFNMCRKCFRELAHEGVLPGVRKASW